MFAQPDPRISTEERAAEVRRAARRRRAALTRIASWRDTFTSFVPQDFLDSTDPDARLDGS
jgi:hypothetical protein